MEGDTGHRSGVDTDASSHADGETISYLSSLLHTFFS